LDNYPIQYINNQDESLKWKVEKFESSDMETLMSLVKIKSLKYCEAEIWEPI